MQTEWVVLVQGPLDVMRFRRFDLWKDARVAFLQAVREHGAPGVTIRMLRTVERWEE